MLHFSSLNMGCQKYFPNLIKDINFILGSLKAVLCSTSFTLCWSVAWLFLHLIRDSCPPLCCQGLVLAPPLFAWYQCSLAVGDRQIGLLLSTSLLLCPYMPFISAFWSQGTHAKEPGTLEDTKDTAQYWCWVADMEQKLNLGWCYCCYSDRKIKPPISSGLN